MTARFLKQMMALALVAGVVVLASATPASASVSVTYHTSGTFTNNPAPVNPGAPGAIVTSSNGGATVTFGNYGSGNGAQLTFVGEPNGTSAIPGGPGYGTITLATTGGGALIKNVIFTLTLTQTMPSSGQGISVSKKLTGSVNFASNGALKLDLSPDSFTFLMPGGTITYTIDNPLTIKSPNNSGGVITLQGGVTATPEPGTVALALTGLPLLGLAAWRRRRTHAV
jgi:hypothetical protein